jgi:preprotein translocase subunit SecG
LSILANILLVVNVFVCIALIAIVLVQRSEGGALGMGGGGGGPGGFMTARGAGDLLTRVTWILAFVFFALAIAQTLIIGRAHGHSEIIDRLNAQSLDFSTPAKPQTAPAAPTSNAPPPQLAPAPATPGVQQPVKSAKPANPNDPFAGLSAPPPAPVGAGQKTP